MQREIDENNIIFHQRSFYDQGYNSMGTIYSQYNEPISGMSTLMTSKELTY